VDFREHGLDREGSIVCNKGGLEILERDARTVAIRPCNRGARIELEDLTQELVGLPESLSLQFSQRKDKERILISTIRVEDGFANPGRVGEPAVLQIRDRVLEFPCNDRHRASSTCYSARMGRCRAAH
jgi:hypothetical protein